ncbi:hypothetical protein KKH05_03490 [Patescibacteria group bacterium]|nr:hypothetical protein [Patescibacteria group bacterium]
MKKKLINDMIFFGARNPDITWDELILIHKINGIRARHTRLCEAACNGEYPFDTEDGYKMLEKIEDKCSSLCEGTKITVQIQRDPRGKTIGIRYDDNYVPF